MYCVFNAGEQNVVMPINQLMSFTKMNEFETREAVQNSNSFEVFSFYSFRNFEFRLFVFQCIKVNCRKLQINSLMF